MSSITVRVRPSVRRASWSFLSEVVLRKAIIMHRCSSAAFFPSVAAGDKKRRESLRSIYVAVAVRSLARSLVACCCLPPTNK